MKPFQNLNVRIMYVILIVLLGILLLMSGCYSSKTTDESIIAAKSELNDASYIVGDVHSSVKSNPEATPEIKADVDKLPEAKKKIDKVSNSLTHVRSDYAKLEAEKDKAVEEKNSKLNQMLTITVILGIIAVAAGGVVVGLKAPKIGLSLMAGGGIAIGLGILVKTAIIIITWAIGAIVVIGVIAVTWRIIRNNKTTEQIVAGVEKLKSNLSSNFTKTEIKEKLTVANMGIQDKETEKQVKKIKEKLNPKV